MNLTLLYQCNSIGEKLVNSLQKLYQDIEQRIVILNDQEYLQIDIIDRYSSIWRIVNTPRAIRNTCNHEQISGILKVNSINYGLSEEETINRTYEIVIADLEVLSVKASNHVKGKTQTKFIREKENQKVADMARRVVYLMGLDIAQVTIVLTAKRRYKVVQVDSSPELRDKDLNRVIDQVKRMAERDHELKNIHVKMGADPEFMLLNSKTGKLISASEFFPREGVIGCDNFRVPNRQQRPIAELRPHPEISPLELTGNIKQALNSASRLAPYRNIRWAAGSQPVGGYFIGGHIHFSSIKLDGGLLRALDNYLGIPVFLIENPTTAAKRRRKYGYLGDYRLKEHGGFEYRTPGSWLVTQRIATAVLCLAKIVANRYAEIPQNYLNTAEAQQAFYKGDQEFFRSLFASLWSNLEKLDLYQDYKEELQVIPEMVLNNINWDEKADLRRNWKIAQAPKRLYSGSNKSSARAVQASSSVSSSANSVLAGGSLSSRSSINRGSNSAGSSSTARDQRSASASQRGRVTSGRARRTNIAR